MSWLLDADVLSQPAKPRGNQAVIAWLEREQDACYTSTIVIAQIAYWVRTKEGAAPGSACSNGLSEVSRRSKAAS